MACLDRKEHSTPEKYKKYLSQSMSITEDTILFVKGKELDDMSLINREDTIYVTTWAQVLETEAETDN